MPAGVDAIAAVTTPVHRLRDLDLRAARRLFRS
jgi:hypothetical protein